MKLKSILLLMLALCLTVCLCACGGDSDSTKKDDQPTTAATEATTTTTTEAVPSATQPVNGKANYTVTVVDKDNNPVVGAMVQMCVDTSCLMPIPTNAQGVAYFDSKDVAHYSVKFATVPAGYILPVGADGMPAPFYFAENTYEMTLVLESAN